MGILGPDGQPYRQQPVEPASAAAEYVQQAVELAAQSDFQAALQQMVAAFQVDVTSDTVIDTTVQIMAQIATSDPVTAEELRLFRQVRDHRSDPAAYLELGNHFAQLGQAAVAWPFLARAVAIIDCASIELKQATLMASAQNLMDLGAYAEAIDTFHRINDDFGGLPIWLVLEMAECYALLRQPEEAEAVYELATSESAAEFPVMQEVRDEVGDLIARVRDYDGEPEMDLRAWHYVQTRGLLVETNADATVPGGRFVLFQPSEEDIAFVVGTVAALLEKRELAPTRLLWLGPNSEPLARLFAEWWEIDPAEVRPYRSGDNNDHDEALALLCMAHSYDIDDETTFHELTPARSGLISFALDVRWTERQPLTPDVAGFLSQACNLPWEPRFELTEDQQNAYQITEERSPEEIAQSIAAHFSPESTGADSIGCDEAAEELQQIYSICSDLILDHRDGSLSRRPLVAHSPIKSPRFGY